LLLAYACETGESLSEVFLGNLEYGMRSCRFGIFNEPQRTQRTQRETRVRLRIFATEVEGLVLLKVLWVQLSMLVQTCRC